MIIEVEGVGPERLERSRRARRLNLSVRPLTGARVAVPYGFSFERAERFVRSMSGWIRKHLARVQQVERDHAAIQQQLPSLDVAAARQQLSARLAELAAAHGFTYRRVVFRRQNTLWGSCSVRNDISLNLKLARLEPALIDYVLLHELAHTRIKNHSRAFWDALRRHVDDVDGVRARLRQYPLHLLCCPCFR